MMYFQDKLIEFNYFILPPLQPLFPYLLEQSTKFCSDRDTNWPVVLKCWPSKAPVDEKAQHELSLTIKLYLNRLNKLNSFWELKLPALALIFNFSYIALLSPIDGIWYCEMRILLENKPGLALLLSSQSCVVSVVNGGELLVWHVSELVHSEQISVLALVGLVVVFAYKVEISFPNCVAIYLIINKI
jgi:hypothetical protein